MRLISWPNAIDQQHFSGYIPYAWKNPHVKACLRFSGWAEQMPPYSPNGGIGCESLDQKGYRFRQAFRVWIQKEDLISDASPPSEIISSSKADIPIVAEDQ